MARILLPDGFGQLNFSIAFVSFFSIIAIFGLDIIGAKEITLNKESRTEIITSILVFRFFVSIILIVFICTAAYFFITPPEQRLTVMVYSIILLSYALNVNFFFQGIERMEYIALLRILSAVMILTGVLIFVHVKEDIVSAVLVYALSNIAVSILSISILHRVFLKFKLNMNVNVLRKLVVDSLPLVISGFMIIIYYNLDIVMLRYMKSEYEVGIYSAAYKIFLVFIIPFGLIFRSFQPGLTKVFEGNIESMSTIMRNYSALMIMTAILGGTILFSLGSWIVLTLYKSDYLMAAGPLSILAMNVLLVGINVLFGNPLTLWNKQKLYTLAVGSGALANIVLNILLIPKYSYIGAAFATLLSEAVVFIGVLIVFNKTISGLVVK